MSTSANYNRSCGKRQSADPPFPVATRVGRVACGAAREGAWCSAQVAEEGRSATTPSVTKPEAIEGALVHGWIDGQIGALDEHWFLTRFTPRTQEANGLRSTAPPPSASFARSACGPPVSARSSARKQMDGGRQPTHHSAPRPFPRISRPRTRMPRAKAFFVKLDRANSYAVLYRVGEAKRPETRAARIAKFVTMLARGERIHEPK